MALIRPQGTLTFVASTASDVVSYVLFQESAFGELNYDSPNVDIGMTTTVQLPVEGLPGIEGEVLYGVAAKDSAGNLSDITVAAPVLIDVTPPDAPTELVYNLPT